MTSSLTVVIPMLNEEENLGRVLDAAREVLDASVPDYEIVLVDDGSTDRTPALADAAAADDARIRVIHNTSNLGLGGALRAGFAVAAKELVLYTDADLPFDLATLPRALRLIERHEADVLSAYRFNRGSEGLRRSVYSFGYSALVRLLFGLRVRDVNFAFKLVRCSLLQRLSLTSQGSFIDAELLIRATRAGARIIQIGVDYFPRTRGASTLARPGVILRILREMIALRGRLRGQA